MRLSRRISLAMTSGSISERYLQIPQIQKTTHRTSVWKSKFRLEHQDYFRRPEGPTGNSRDRKVVVRKLEMNIEARRTGMTLAYVGAAGPQGLSWIIDPDLT